MLDVRNISVDYGGAAIVREVSFALAAGEIVALLGANGAGKTTILKSLNGGLPLSSGEIFLDGKSLQKYSRREIARRIAVVAQETETKFPVTILEFAAAGRFAHAAAFARETAEDLRIARECLAQCDLANYEARLMNELSGGERQRVVLARALATEAQIFLLDEPTANLDLAHQALMFRLVREKCETRGAAAIVITHDLNLAAEFADEILLLKDGEIIVQGAPRDVLTTGNLRRVFAVEVFSDAHPHSGKPRITMIY